MAQSKDIKFWSDRFIEHFNVAKATSEKNGIELSKEMLKAINESQSQWVKIKQNPQLIVENRAIIQSSLITKAKVRELFIKEEIPCLPDLFHHMMEELAYFEVSVLDQGYTFLDEMKWWAHEHAENLDFVNCYLHQLITEDSFLARLIGKPTEVEKMIADNANLSQKFTDLSNLTASETQFYKKLTDLKVKHLDGVSHLISKVDLLPLEEDTKKLLHEMLKHESQEADYAFDRLKRLAGKK